MTTIRVIHMRKYGKKSKEISKGHEYIYCGRPSKLGNPYNMKNEGQRNKVIQQFREDKQCQKICNELSIYVLEKGLHMLELGCFCAPKACHCDVIKQRVENIVNKID